MSKSIHLVALLDASPWPEAMDMLCFSNQRTGSVPGSSRVSHEAILGEVCKTQVESCGRAAPGLDFEFIFVALAAFRTADMSTGKSMQAVFIL